MSQQEKALRAIMHGANDRGIAFADLRGVLERLGFQCRVKGDHYIYTKDGVEEIVNIQPLGNMAKPYQVKQTRQIILKYRLGGVPDEV